MNTHLLNFLTFKLVISLKHNIIFAKFLKMLLDNNWTSLHTHIRLQSKNRFGVNWVYIFWFFVNLTKMFLKMYCKTSKRMSFRWLTKSIETINRYKRSFSLSYSLFFYISMLVINCFRRRNHIPQYQQFYEQLSYVVPINAQDWWNCTLVCYIYYMFRNSLFYQRQSVECFERVYSSRHSEKSKIELFINGFWNFFFKKTELWKFLSFTCTTWSFIKTKTVPHFWICNV